jgi:hypothetical protein
MSTAHVALVLLLLPSTLLTQSARQFDRRDRIVLWSRHFDEIPQPSGPLNCPAQPGRVYGFESPRSERAAGRLLVRVFGPDTTALGKDGQWVSIQLSHVLVDSTWVAVREPQFVTRADTLGGASLDVPIGVYRLSVSAIAYSRAEAVIQIRGGANDSLRVFVSRAINC